MWSRSAIFFKKISLLSIKICMKCTSYRIETVLRIWEIHSVERLIQNNFIFEIDNEKWVLTLFLPVNEVGLKLFNNISFTLLLIYSRYSGENKSILKNLGIIVKEINIFWNLVFRRSVHCSQKKTATISNNSCFFLASRITLFGATSLDFINIALLHQMLRDKF